MSEIHSVEREELMAYLDGELSAARAAEIAKHVNQCADCRAFAADLGGVSQRLMAWQADAADAGVPPRIAEALGAKAPHRRFFPVWARWAVGVPAAILLVLLSAGLPKLNQSRRGDIVGDTTQRAAAPAPPPAAKRMVERRAEIVLTATNFDQARAGLDSIVHRHGGYTGSLTVSAPQGAPRTLDATLRVPADQLDTVLTELKALGRVEQESQNGEEVTAQYVDLEARLANARNTESRLTELLRERTGKLSDVLQVEEQVSRVRGEIEQMEAERKSLLNLVDFATVSVKLTEGSRRAAATLERLRDAALDGWQSAGRGLFGAITLLLSYGPALVIWLVVLYFPVRLGWKKLRRGA
jgi:hypothetical protein